MYGWSNVQLKHEITVHMNISCVSATYFRLFFYFLSIVYVKAVNFSCLICLYCFFWPFTFSKVFYIDFRLYDEWLVYHILKIVYGSLNAYDCSAWCVVVLSFVDCLCWLLMVLYLCYLLMLFSIWNWLALYKSGLVFVLVMKALCFLSIWSFVWECILEFLHQIPLKHCHVWLFSMWQTSYMPRCAGMWDTNPYELWSFYCPDMSLSFAATYQNAQGNQGENDPNNTTVRSLS